MPLFVVQANAVAAAAAAAKTACQIATTTTKVAKIVSIDITFDGVTATNTPIQVQLVRCTAAGSGGSTFTPVLLSGEAAAVTASATARISDTTPGASPTILYAWYIPPTGGFSYQWPLGREVFCKVSEFYELKTITVAGSGTPNYNAQLVFEE